MKKKIEFPAANISISDWDKNEDYLLYVLFDPWLNATKLFPRYYHNQSFVDSNGNVFKITNPIESSRNRRLFGFIPLSGRMELEFEPTGATMEMEDVRRHMLRQLEKLDSHGPEAAEQQAAWIANVKKAQTIADIISGD